MTKPVPEDVKPKEGIPGADDVKPQVDKINLVIDFEGQTCTVKVKPSTSLKRLFEAAEIKFGKEPGTLKFMFDGERLQPQGTPQEHAMMDGDTIDAHLEQVGGACLC